MNHNQILGVKTGASAGEIQKAFRAAAMEIHPDHNNGPEAAEAFGRIQEARNKLIEQAKLYEASRDAASVQTIIDDAIKATANAAYAAQQPIVTQPDEPTPEEIAHIQELDRLALRYARGSLLTRRSEPEEVRRHRRKIDTANKRISGRY